MGGERWSVTAGWRRRAGARSALAWSRQCPWAAGIVEMRQSASLIICVAWCVWVRLWSAHTGTRLVTAVPLGRWHCWNAAVSFAQNVRCMVCVCLWSAHTGTRLVTGSALGQLALLKCGGRLRSVCALLGGCVCLWSAHTGTCLVTRSALEPLALLECGVQFRTVCALLGVYGCAYGRRTPLLAWSQQCPWAAGIVGMRRSASYSMCVAWCVWVPMVGAHRHSPGHGQCP